MKILALIFLTILMNSAHALEFKTNTKEENVNRLLNEIKSELPEPFIQKIPETIEIEFKNLNKVEVKKIDEQCSEKIILGLDQLSKKNNKIQIDHVFLNELKNPERKIQCAHKNIKNYFKATIIHELAHMYDVNTKISKTPLFLNLSGFVIKGILIKRRVNLNQNIERSVDSYEFKNHLESFAVNFEHFMYSPEFKCRKPSMFQFYQEEFKLNPFSNINCEINRKIVITKQTSSGESNSESLIKELDPSRLYQIHYLLAGKGTQAMSRFGHAMFRLVFCAPNKPISEKCMNDVSHHIVVSFRANIQEMTMSYAKGLNGEYPSQLFFLSLPEVVDEYTKGEFREITSVPLKLSKIQRERFLNRASELFWSYRGKYYFFTNNCATEAMNLIRVAIKEVDDSQTKHIITPNALNNYFNDAKISDLAVFNDLKVAESQGYFYRGVGPKLLSSMKLLNIKTDNFEKFVNENSGQSRMKIYENALLNSPNKILTAANALRLEDLILRSKEIKFAKEIGARVFGNDPDPKITEGHLKEKIIAINDLYKKLEPAQFLRPGYGIPLVDEFETIPNDVIQDVLTSLNDYADDLKSISLEFFPKEVEEIKIASENRHKLLKIIASR